MKDYHTHHTVPQGGYLNAVTREDWQRVIDAPEQMIPCIGIHPWHAAEVELADIAFELDEWLTKYPQAHVGESGLDASDKYADSLGAQRALLEVHLGAAFRHDRMIQLHGVQAWSELLDILRRRHLHGTLPQVLLHAWNGSMEMAREFLALGVCFSIGLRELQHSKAEIRYARLPKERLFLESDNHPENWPRALAIFGLMRHGIS